MSSASKTNKTFLPAATGIFEIPPHLSSIVSKMISHDYRTQHTYTYIQFDVLLFYKYSQYNHKLFVLPSSALLFFLQPIAFLKLLFFNILIIFRCQTALCTIIKETTTYQPNIRFLKQKKEMNYVFGYFYVFSAPHFSNLKHTSFFCNVPSKQHTYTISVWRHLKIFQPRFSRFIYDSRDQSFSIGSLQSKVNGEEKSGI